MINHYLQLHLNPNHFFLKCIPKDKKKKTRYIIFIICLFINTANNGGLNQAETYYTP